MAAGSQTGTHTVVAAGQYTATLTHPLWNNGTPVSVEGFKLEGQMLQAQQLMDSAKVIALANGNTITITNNNKAGTITFNVTATGGNGDLVKIARYLKRVGDSQGGTIRITQEINGATDGMTYYACTVKSCPDQIIQGNDAPDYQVVFNYGESQPDQST
jgi:hypothetical protein